MLAPAQRAKLRRVVAIANDKGGVGKTSLASNLAGLLAAAGLRVLLIDLDDQANTGEDLGYTYRGEGDAGLAALQAITARAPLTPITGVRENLDVVPAGEHTTELADVLQGRQRRSGSEAVFDALAISLEPIAATYDLIIIDCPPKVRVMQEMALGAARWLLAPTKSDSSSRKAIGQIAERFVEAREFNPHLDLLGVVLFASGTSASRLRDETAREIAADLGTSDLMISAYIRHAEVPAAQARNSGRLVHELEEVAQNQIPWFERLKNPKARQDGAPVAASVSGLATDYQQLTEQVLERLREAEAAEAAETETGR